MFITLLKAMRTLLAYLIIGLFFGAIAAPLLPFIKNNNMPFRIWYLLDVLVCTIAHNTNMRTISGFTGQYITKHKRFYYSAKVIDWLAELFGDKPEHCKRMYQWEIEQGIATQ
ncbi:hypothetical protein Q4503_16455 [Colwellia sp. 6_MG-2023]|uniref:hypothetical protein n=1 Tax=Colwellia sp. 6_MG-2023 TaxID=3062676 RepID=UPI0026E11A74|nr:hypothetical protein [Colwellia sp. 6_MG-2023]MDO6489288.1 hypothetical protein [Colwellia sp. 6_MG-2023]